MAQLHHKWCVHSVLPVAPRVKQLTQFNTTNINCNTEESVFCALTGTQTHTHAHTVHLAVELTRFQLTAGGGERSGPNMSMWFCYVHVRWVGGGNIASCERVRNCSHVTDRYVSQQCQLRIGRCVRPSALNLLPCYQISCRFDMNERTKTVRNFWPKDFL